MRTRSAPIGMLPLLRRVARRLVLACALLPAAGLDAEPVRIGVLAFRPRAQTLEQWQPLALALNKALPGRDFTIEVFAYSELNEAVAARRLDFVLTNPGHFVLLKTREQLSAPIATLVVDQGGRAMNTFGGVIFCLQGDARIQTLQDLKGRRLAFTSTESLGGYQMQAFELSRAGVRLPQDATLVATGVPHDRSVEAVLSGRADVGFVRDGVLESMAREGRLDLSKVRVIHRQEIPGSAVLLSTRLYPEWPIAARPGLEPNLVRQVASALLGMEENRAATGAMGIHGFGVAADYTPVEELLRELRMPPFEAVPRFTAGDIWIQYRRQVLAGLAAAGLILFLSLRLFLVNRRLASEKRAVQQEHEKLLVSETENRALISAIPDMIFTNHRDGTFLEVHASDPSLLLVPREALLHRKPADVLPPDLADQFLKAYADALASGALQEFTYSLPIAGEARHFEARVVPSAEDRVITIVRDVTHGKRAEQALRASQELFFKAFATSPEAININRLEDGVYLAVNEGFTRITGFTAQDVVGRPSSAPECQIWQNAEDRERLAALLRAEGKVTGFEAPFLSKNGGPIAGLMSAAIVEIDGSICIISITQDITSRKRAEEEKARLQAQLGQAQKLESVGRLAGGIAHDMNNVLGAIMGLASVHIETSPAGSPVHRAFDTISKAATRGGKVLKSLLSIARQSPAEERELDLNELLREQVSLLEHTTLAKVRLELDLDPQTAPVLGDANALSHAFMNLCVNAVDAMPENGVLTLRTRALDPDWIEVQVEDTGCGMPSAVLERALDPFFTTKPQGKGTGLGLALAHSTVVAHRGAMEIWSEPGRGTRVSMRFPACRPGPAAKGEALLANLEDAAASLRILLVDDDVLIQASLLEMFRSLGHAVTTASSGEEALRHLESGYAPDAVILDMNMPGLGGAGTLPRLRAARPFLPVLLATGRPDQTAMDLVAAHPHVTLLPKPFGMKELQRQLELIRPDAEQAQLALST